VLGEESHDIGAQLVQTTERESALPDALQATAVHVVVEGLFRRGHRSLGASGEGVDGLADGEELNRARSGLPNARGVRTVREAGEESRHLVDVAVVVEGDDARDVGAWIETGDEHLSGDGLGTVESMCQS
jgi:hypothetical protein